MAALAEFEALGQMPIVKTFTAHLILLLTIAWAIRVEGQGTTPTVSALYRLEGLERGYANAEATYGVETRSLPTTPEGSAKREQLRKQFEQLQTKIFTNALELAHANRNSEHGVAVLDWMLKQPNFYDLPCFTSALDLMNQQYAEHANIGYVIANLAYPGFLPSEDNPARRQAMDILNKVAIKNPNRTARGQAAYGLATIARDKCTEAESSGSADLDRLASEAEEAFKKVLRDYGDCLYLRTVGMRPAKTTLGEEAKSELSALSVLRSLRIGQSAPEIRGEDLSGSSLRLSDTRGKVVLLVFWASSCGPCMWAVPHEKQLVERFSKRPFVLIGVNGDDVKADAVKAVSKHQIPWRSFWGAAQTPSIAENWGVRGWPTVYVLDHEGVIRHKFLQGEQLDDPLERLVRAAEVTPRNSQ